MEPAIASKIPPCPHFGQCGGCTLQDRPDDAVAAWKREGVVRALRAVGLTPEVEATRTVPAHDRRRVKLAYTRTKKTTVLGFYAAGSHTVIPVPECEVARPEILAGMEALSDLLRHGAPRKRALAVTVTVSEGGLDVSVADGKELDLPLREALGMAAEQADLARLVWNGEPVAVRRPATQRFGKALVTPPPGAFLQASAAGEAILTTLILDAVEGAKSVADLFSGCGAFSLPMAESAAVIAVEGDAPMIEALDAGWRSAAPQGLHAVTSITRDLFRRPLLPDDLNRFDAIVFDPPRAGAQAQATEIAASTVPIVVGVSCMPSTFARDAATLAAGGYTLERVVPIDQFRWSTHVEIFGLFRRKS